MESEKLRKQRIKMIFAQAKMHPDTDCKMELKELSLGKEDFDALNKEFGFKQLSSSLGNWHGIEIKLDEKLDAKDCSRVSWIGQITHIQIIGNPSTRTTKKWKSLRKLKIAEKTQPRGHCKDCNSYQVPLCSDYFPGSYEAGTCNHCGSSNTELEECSMCGSQLDGTIEHLPGRPNEHQVTYWVRNGKYICLKCHTLNPSNRTNP